MNKIILIVGTTVIITLVLIQLFRVMWRLINNFRKSRIAARAYEHLKKTNPKYLDFLAKEFNDVSDEEILKYVILGAVYEEETADEKLIDFAKRLKKAKFWTINGDYVYIEK